VNLYTQFLATIILVTLERSQNPYAETYGGVNLQEGRSERLCVLAVPNHMTGSDFCQFTGAFIQNIKEMRFVRYLITLKYSMNANGLLGPLNRLGYWMLPCEGKFQS
jgi:hypothetical protein